MNEPNESVFRKVERAVGIKRPDKPIEITMTEFRTQPGELARAVSCYGCEFVVTKNGKPVMRVLPTEEAEALRVGAQLRSVPEGQY